MRTGAAALLVLAALAVFGGGASSRAEAGRTVNFPKSYDLALISARSGAVLQVSKRPVRAAVADGRGGWFVTGSSGLVHMLSSGKLDSAWGSRESRSLSACGPLTTSGARLYATATLNRARPAGGAVRACVIEAFDVRKGARLWVSADFSESVYALEASSTRVYVGGTFTSVGREERQGLAALDAGTGRLLGWRGPELRSFATPAIEALTLAGSRLYVGGAFSLAGSQPRTNLAALDPASGALLPWNPKGGGVVDTGAIAVTHGQVVTAGLDGLAAFDVRSGRRPSWASRLAADGTLPSADGSLINFGEPSVLAAAGSLVYLGGNLHHSCCGDSNLGAFDLAVGRMTDWNPSLGVPYVSIGQIVPSGMQVLVIGSFVSSIG